MKRRDEMNPEELARIEWATNAAIPEFENLPFFDRINTQGRFRIADTLVRMIGTENITIGQKVEETFFEKDGCAYSKPIRSGGQVFTPDQRLNWLIDVVVEDWGKWPDDGLRDMRSTYCRFFPPADGKEVETTEFAELAHPPLAPQKAEAALPGPGDEPIGEELHKRIADVAEQRRLQ